MPCVRATGCICEGSGYCPNWLTDEAYAALAAAYAQPAPDPFDCPNCGGYGRVRSYGGYIRCEVCNPNTGEPPDQERAP